MLGSVVETTVTAEEPNAGPYIFGVSSAMRSLGRVVADIAPTDIPVLLLGESGTGKEALALEIHRCSRRYGNPLVKCYCANTTLDLLPISSAAGNNGASLRTSQKPTGGGSVFLSDISQLSSASQNRLSHLLPDGDRIPSGRYLDARLISATT